MMRWLIIAVFVWVVAITSVGILLRDSEHRLRAIGGTAIGAAGSVIVLYCIQKRKGLL